MPFDVSTLSTYTPLFYPTEKGKTYTLSIKVKPEKSMSLRMGPEGKTIMCTGGVWTTLTHTFIAGATEATRFWGIYGSGFTALSGWIEYRGA